MIPFVYFILLPSPWEWVWETLKTKHKYKRGWSGLASLHVRKESWNCKEKSKVIGTAFMRSKNSAPQYFDIIPTCYGNPNRMKAPSYWMPATFVRVLVCKISSKNPRKQSTELRCPHSQTFRMQTMFLSGSILHYHLGCIFGLRGGNRETKVGQERKLIFRTGFHSNTRRLV